MKTFTTTLILLLFIGFSEPRAQTTVVFNVNLKPQLEDSVLVPGRGDRVYVTGNLYPLGRNQKVRLRDEEPADSVFTAEIKFQRRFQGRQLNYNFLLETPGTTHREQMPHRIRLEGGTMELDALYFDSYAW